MAVFDANKARKAFRFGVNAVFDRGICALVEFLQHFIAVAAVQQIINLHELLDGLTNGPTPAIASLDIATDKGDEVIAKADFVQIVDDLNSGLGHLEGAIAPVFHDFGHAIIRVTRNADRETEALLRFFEIGKIDSLQDQANDFAIYAIEIDIEGFVIVILALNHLIFDRVEKILGQMRPEGEGDDFAIEAHSVFVSANLMSIPLKRD